MTPHRKDGLVTVLKGENSAGSQRRVGVGAKKFYLELGRKDAKTEGFRVEGHEVAVFASGRAKCNGAE